MHSLVWFRRDLRVMDNPALSDASKNTEGGVIGVYFVTPKQWNEHDDAKCKVKFWLDNVSILSRELAKLNIPLQEWQYYYNWQRPHGALNGKTPKERYFDLCKTAPDWHSIELTYDQSEERIQEKDYQLDLKLRKLKRCV